MSGLWDVFKSVFENSKYVDINLSELPSRGRFYTDEFYIKIKQAELEDIEEYNISYVDGNFMSIFAGIKCVVENNVKLAKGYAFQHIISIDVLYLFLEIVKLTKNKDIFVEIGVEKIKFCSENFNYFEFTDKYMKNFDKVAREFVYDGFKYSPPTVGAESSISSFLYSMSSKNRMSEFVDSSYDFLYFLGGKTELDESEIENLITIFNDELTDVDKKTISNIIEEFKPVSKYTLKSKNGIVPLEGIDLKSIWEV